MDLPDPVHPTRGLVDTHDQLLQFPIPYRACRGGPLLRGIVGGRGDRHVLPGENRADRLDTPPVATLVDELHDQRCGRSSSAAKKPKQSSGSRWPAQLTVLLLQRPDPVDIRDGLYAGYLDLPDFDFLHPVP